MKNNASTRDNAGFVEKAINELLIKGIAVECKDKPYMVNPLTVASNKTKQRLVLDVRDVNPCLLKENITFEDLSFASTYFKQGQYMIGFDLTSGYHHVDIFQTHQTFLGFAWDFGHGRRYFKFTSLAFGISTAGFIFTKVLHTLIRVWREKGICAFIYLDDGLIALKNCAE